MATALFDQIIFGPVRSRRLGLSLGVNLSPVARKFCNFDCIYCECGSYREGRAGEAKLPKREEVAALLEEKLGEMVAAGTPPDVITFSGNGEPSMHPDFAGVIDDTIAIRDRLCPKAKVSVLSNATMLKKQGVREALLKIDNNILKLDSAFDKTVRLIDCPPPGYSVAQVVEDLGRFKGRLIVQTMFLRGEVGGEKIDNTTEEEVAAWLEILKKINPKQVMIYSLDRDTPVQTLQKVSSEELKSIADRVRALGIDCIST